MCWFHLLFKSLETPALIFTLFVIVTITFFLMHAMPGDPFMSIQDMPDEIIHNMKVKYGL